MSPMEHFARIQRLERGLLRPNDKELGTRGLDTRHAGQFDGSDGCGRHTRVAIWDANVKPMDADTRLSIAFACFGTSYLI